MYYAQINDENICIAVSKLHGEVKEGNLLQIPIYDSSILGKKYENGKWMDIPQKKEQNPITEQEQIAIDTALNVEYIACLLEAALT